MGNRLSAVQELAPVRRAGPRGRAAAVWLYERILTIASGDEPLAQDQVDYHPDKRLGQAVAEPQRHETPHWVPRLPL